MYLPWIVLAAGVVPIAPAVAAPLGPGRLRGGRAFVFAWCVFIVVASLGMRLASTQGHSNLWTAYLIVPTEGSLVLWALSTWQSRPLLRSTLRAAIPAALVAFIALVLLFENTNAFSRFTSPMYSLICLGAALAALVSRAIDETDSLLRQDWFWITGGMALYFGASAALTPLAGIFLRTHPELVVRAWEVYGGITIVAFLVITVGMLCPTRPQPSGMSSSAPSSASP